MATENYIIKTTLVAGADYNSAGQYHAFALADGQLAANIEEATGILLNKPKDTEFAEIGYFGEMKFAAGKAISKGAKLVVTGSGWFITANSFENNVGEAKAAVSSGAIGTGFFNFPNVRYSQDMDYMSIGSSNAGLIAGIGVALSDLSPANDGEECAGVAMTAIGSGDAGKLVVGKVNLRIDPAKVASMGDLLRCTTSGYFIPCDSGYFANARALANIGSNAVGSALFYSVPCYLGK